MKKLLPILLVLMMLCSTAFAAGFEVPAEGYDGSEVTITFCTQQGTALQEVTANYIAEFNKLYPNIHVEHTTQGSYDDGSSAGDWYGYGGKGGSNGSDGGLGSVHNATDKPYGGAGGATGGGSGSLRSSS